MFTLKIFYADGGFELVANAFNVRQYPNRKIEFSYDIPSDGTGVGARDDVSRFKLVGYGGSVEEDITLSG